ncbi:helix-turn-helix domain-containing protein [Bacillus badius]|uniref:Transcriptional regulator n=1 Tax=Bacillus badius TaxID=1455 RepID=A0ABR5AP29_BACBA|nr:helix-turn-helix domain-containing protein [Bacillus badius]KIL73731.1 transcriptional regulator [Bacillus badius]MED4715253.1 helix-turn-helix domain-containing protein [Bacillus badius]
MLVDRLISLRKAKKYTQQEFAKRLGIPRSTYSNYEAGNREPDNSTLKLIAEKLETTTDYLLGRTDDPKPSEEEFNSLAEINRMVKEYGIESFGFFDIEQWKKLSREDVEEIRKHFEWVAHKAKERNESDFDD